MNAEQLDSYDAGLLNDFGGGNVGWWQDYIRAELERAHEHYKVQVDALFEGKVLVPVEPTREMLWAGQEHTHDSSIRLKNVYKAMLAASQEQGK